VANTVITGMTNINTNGTSFSTSNSPTLSGALSFTITSDGKTMKFFNLPDYVPDESGVVYKTQHPLDKNQTLLAIKD
jgi:hypothetical protein